MTDSEPVFGVIGAGRWGGNLVATAAKMGVLGAVCDADEELLGRLRERHPGLATTTSVEEMLSKPVDAVLIATPAETHAAIALAALAADKHVFVEKPLALNADDAAAVVEAARRASRRLFVGHVVLYQKAIRRALEIVRSGAIGKLWHVRARRASFGRLRYVEDAWWSFAPHDVASVLEFFGEEPIHASIVRRPYATPGIADFAYGDFEFPSGGSAHVEVTWLDPKKGAMLDVFGSDGYLSLVDGKEGATLQVVSCGCKVAAGGRAELWREGEETIEFGPDEPLRTELEAFADLIRHGTPVPTDGEAGLRVVRALTMASPLLSGLDRRERMPA